MKLSQAIQGFILTKESEGYSPNTTKNYKRQMVRLCTFLGDKEIESVTTINLREFLSMVRNSTITTPSGRIKKNTESTVCAYWRTVRSFYTWAEVELEITRPDKVIPMPKVAKIEIAPFTYEEIKALIRACEYSREAVTENRKAYSMKRATGLRDRFIVLLLLDTGIRVSELARLKVKELSLSNNEIFINPIGSGAKSKSRRIPIGKGCRSMAWKYLASRNDIEQEDLLVVTRENKPMDRNSIKNILKRIAENCQVKNVHPHRFRHTFACEYLKNGGDIFTLQKILGHSSLVMVRYYLYLTSTDTTEAHRKASPVDKWHL